MAGWGGVDDVAPQTFVTASVVFRRGDDILTVRKRGTHRFMLPGGKIEAGESPAECAAREAAEEVGAVLDPAGLTSLGRFSAPAANEPGAVVVSDVFVTAQPLDAHPSAEIEECRWTSIVGPLPHDVAPLLVEQVVPALLVVDRP